MSTRTRLLLLDLDNTLYDWVGFFVPAMRAMLAVMERRLEASDEQLLAELRGVYARAGSVEYAFCVQAMPSVTRLPFEHRRVLVADCRQAFAAARAERLVPYPGVHETLRTLRRAGISVVATTNAPLYQAAHRLQQLGIAEDFDGVAARESFPVPDDRVVSDRIRRNGDLPQRARFRHAWKLAPAELKPSTRMYELILRTTATEPSAALAVGDSIVKDLLPAVRLGARAAWARYGSEVDEAMWDLLVAVTPWSSHALAQHASRPQVRAAPLERFSDLLELV